MQVKEKFQAEPIKAATPAKPVSIYADPQVAEAKSLVDKMRGEVEKAEREFAAASGRGNKNPAETLLSGQSPGISPQEAMENLRIAREGLMLAQKRLDIEAIRASGELYEREKSRHGAIAMKIFQSLLELQSALRAEDDFIDALRDGGVITTLTPVSLHGASDILRRMRSVSIEQFGSALKARFDN